MTALDAIILGIVEGLTEFLPISSTGHLILTGHFLGLQEDSASKAFEVVIQFGAIMAVVVLYRKKLWDLTTGALKKAGSERHFFIAILAAFLPTAALGLLLNSIIKTHLFSPGPVIGALIVGGIFMILIERLRKPPSTKAQIDVRSGLVIGLFQSCAMWPGTSRSMMTILGARLFGMSARDAAEFSFFLAIPTLGAAAFYDLIKARHELLASQNVSLLLLGSAVSFVVAWIVIKAFIAFLGKRSLEVFGWYRILLGLGLAYLLYWR